MADTITVKFKVMEDGSLKAVGKDAEKAAAALEKTSRSTDKATKSADKYSKKNKGVAQATSNSTKAFSKMTTGIQGGLVPAYATLAANVFALTAVFGTLSRIDAVSKLEQGLEHVGRAAGTNLKLISQELQNIAGGALSAEQAMRATALGISSGFGKEEIQGLAEVARGASLALGRDMGDAMDRLIRGAAKLEPEILDELGIMVRLDKATKDYADTLNKNVADLSQFERRMAFTNAILEQGREKFQDISDAIDPSAYSKLGAAFQDLTKTVISGINVALNPLVDFFSKTPAALAGVAAVFTGGMVSQLIGGLQGIGESAADAAERTEEHAKAALKAIKPHEKMGKAFNEVAKSTDRSDEALKRMLKSVNMSINMTSKDAQKLKIATKARAALTKEIFRQELAESKRTLAGTLGTLQVYGARAAFAQLGTELSILRTKTLAAAAGQGILTKAFILGSAAGTALASTVRLIGAAFLRFLPYIGLAVSALSLIMPYFKKEETGLERSIKRSAERMAEFNVILAQYKTTLSGITQQQSAFVRTTNMGAGLAGTLAAETENIYSNFNELTISAEQRAAEANKAANQKTVESLKAEVKTLERRLKQPGRKDKLQTKLRNAEKELKALQEDNKIGASLRFMPDFGPVKNAVENAANTYIDTQEGILRTLRTVAAKGADVSDSVAIVIEARDTIEAAKQEFLINPSEESLQSFIATAKQVEKTMKQSKDAIKAIDEQIDELTNKRRQESFGIFKEELDLIKKIKKELDKLPSDSVLRGNKSQKVLEQFGIKKKKKTTRQTVNSELEMRDETNEEALTRYYRKLKQLDTDYTEAKRKQAQLMAKEALGLTSITDLVKDQTEVRNKLLAVRYEEKRLATTDEGRTKAEEAINTLLKERLNLLEKITAARVDVANRTGMGATMSAAFQASGNQDKIRSAYDARIEGETDESKIAALEKERDSVAKSQAAEDTKMVFRGLAEDMAKLGPEGELMSSVISGVTNLQEAWTMSFSIMSDNTQSMSDRVSAGLGMAISLVANLGAMYKAASKAKIMGIDNEIAAEKARDGVTAASIQKIRALEAKKEKEKRKAFEKDKKMKIAQTVMATAQGIMQAFTLGPIVGAIMGTVIAALGAKQISLIKGTTYDGGGGSPSVGGAGSAGVQVGQRSNTVDLAKANNPGGELAYARGDAGAGNMSDFKPAFTGYKHRAAGGYVVGEQGPELFVPETPGEIIPSGKQVGGQTNINFSISAVDAAGVEDLLINQRGNIIGMIREAANEHGELFLESVREKSY